jgi:hypothetical protein
VYVKSKEESTAGSSSAHAGDSNAATESAIAISWRRGRGSRDFFQRDEAAVGHLVEADEPYAARFLPLQNITVWELSPLPLVFVSVASKSLRVHVSGLESTLAGTSISVDSKGS